MKKIIACILLILIPQISFAEEPKELPPLDPKFVGTHGMVLLNHNSTILASHLPMYKSPHNIQLVYKLEVKDIALVQLIRDADLVTIKPDPFNIQRLLRGEEFSVKADVYMGHFERDGLLTYENVDITFETLIYSRILDEIKPSNTRQEYAVVELRSKTRLLIHNIQTAPSYDHLLLLTDDTSCIVNFNTSKAVPTENEIYYKLTYCGSIKPLYFETEDFKGN
jgi:hypothetical protein